MTKRKNYFFLLFPQKHDKRVYYFYWTFVKEMTLKSIGIQINISTKAAEQLKSRAWIVNTKNI